MVSLGGRVIACLEARYASELADLVTRHGGITYAAPCLREVHEPDAVETRHAVDVLCRSTTHAAIFLTGVGVQTIVEGARRLGREQELLAGLAQMRVVVRGPKTLNALRQLNVRVDLSAPEPYTCDCLLGAIANEWDLNGQTVLVQLYGAPAPAFSAGLRNLGAHVIEASPYRWERPSDQEPVVRLIEDLSDGWIDVLAATNAAQVDQLFGIARERGFEQDLRRALELPRLSIAAQGIVCASAFEKQGVRVDVIPPRASMGALIVAIARCLNQPSLAQTPARPAGLVAVFVTDDVPATGIKRVLGEVATGSTIGLLDVKGRRGERRAEAAAIELGLALERVRPVHGERHPADELVRRASRVLIVTRQDSTRPIGRIVQLAERYAKPVRVERLAPDQELTG